MSMKPGQQALIYKRANLLLIENNAIKSNQQIAYQHPLTIINGYFEVLVINGCYHP